MLYGYAEAALFDNLDYGSAAKIFGILPFPFENFWEFYQKKKRREEYMSTSKS